MKFSVNLLNLFVDDDIVRKMWHSASLYTKEHFNKGVHVTVLEHVNSLEGLGGS